MSAEEMVLGSICQVTFGSPEEVQIKEEKPEIDEEKQLNFDQGDDFKDENTPLDISESDSDYSPKKKKSKKNNLNKAGQIKIKKSDEKANGNNGIKAEGKKKRGRPKKEKSEIKPKKETKDFSKDFFDSSNLELSEDFVIFILRQVDELCENIRNGDPDLERTLEVNQNLNNAVNCYRNKLDLDKQILIKSESDYHAEMGDIGFDNDDYHDYDTKDIDYFEKFAIVKKPAKSRRIEDPNVPKRKNKRGPSAPGIKLVNDEKFAIVKSQCGRHSVLSMALMLNMPKNTVHDRIKKEGVIFTEKDFECQFCVMKKKNEDIGYELLYPLIRLDNDTDQFECSICNFLVPDRSLLYTHIR